MYRGYRDSDGKIVMDKEYLDHEVFESLNSTSQFYHDLSDNVMTFVQKWVRNAPIVNYNSYIFEALANSLESIKVVLGLGHITDAKALLRNLFDESIVNLYFMARLKRKGDDVLSQSETDNLSSELKLEELYDINTSDWLSDNKTKILCRELRYDEMSKYLRQEECLSGIIEYLESPKCKTTRNQLNDAVHFNYYRTILLNDGILCIDGERKYELDQLKTAVEQISMFHITCVFCLEPAYMMASDYCDYKDCGLEPPADVHYDVAPFIQEYLEDTVYETFPEWAEQLIAVAHPMKLRGVGG